MDRTGAPEREAWHEAGHAVIAHLLGGEVREVTLESDDDAFEGRVTVAWPARTAVEVAERSGRAALAGPLAELARYEDGSILAPRRSARRGPATGPRSSAARLSARPTPTGARRSRAMVQGRERTPRARRGI